MENKTQPKHPSFNWEIIVNVIECIDCNMRVQEQTREEWKKKTKPENENDVSVYYYNRKIKTVSLSHSVQTQCLTNNEVFHVSQFHILHFSSWCYTSPTQQQQQKKDRKIIHQIVVLWLQIVVVCREGECLVVCKFDFYSNFILKALNKSALLATHISSIYLRIVSV